LEWSFGKKLSKLSRAFFKAFSESGVSSFANFFRENEFFLPILLIKLSYVGQISGWTWLYFEILN
jgi:hypothetical protein